MRILLIEDHEKLRESLKFQLAKEGFLVDSLENGEDAWFYISQHIYDLILLDRMLPDMDGLSLLKTMRQKKDETPVLLLTALGSLQDKVTGLNLGADDYLVKPFAFEELLARIRCISRRPRQVDTGEILSFGDISLRARDFFLEGPCASCLLAFKEGQLLEVFLRSKGQTLTRTFLLNRVWGPDSEVADSNLDNYIHFLRRRLEAVSDTVFLRTVRNVGYCLEERRGK